MIVKEHQRCCDKAEGCPKGQNPQNCGGCTHGQVAHGQPAHGKAGGSCGGSCGGCSGSGCSHGGCGSAGGRVITVNQEERAFLLELAQLPFLPLARFVMKSTDSDASDSVVLAPVYLTARHDTLDEVLIKRAVLLSLAAKRFVSLDYGLPLKNGDYDIYYESDVYKEFCEGAEPGEEGVSGFAGRPVMELGSIALTGLGQEALDSLDE
jgi:hypothetical protein